MAKKSGKNIKKGNLNKVTGGGQDQQLKGDISVEVGVPEVVDSPTVYSGPDNFPQKNTNIDLTICNTNDNLNTTNW